MSAPIDIPKVDKKYPYIEVKCSFCSNTMTINERSVPNGSYTSCVGCRNRICNDCAPEMQKNFGNKYRMISEYFVNNCDECDPDYNTSLSEVSSDCDSAYEDSQ